MQDQNSIRRHMRSIEETRKTTSAMHLISSVHLRKTIGPMEYNKQFLRRILGCFHDILDMAPGATHKYMEDRPADRVMYIVVSGDKGMCGGYNHAVAQKALEIMKKHNAKEKYVVTVGLVGEHMLRSQGVLSDIQVLGISQNPSLDNARSIATDLFDHYDQGLMDQVYLIYTRFDNNLEKTPICFRLLPLIKVKRSSPTKEGRREMLYHPSTGAVMDQLVPQYVVSIIYSALLQSYASEQSARMNAMDNAAQSADEMLKKLTLNYNMARQAAITQEITETTRDFSETAW